MKIVDKIALAIFSVFMLIISVVYILVYFGIMEFSLLNQGLNFIFTEEPTKTVLLVVAIISVILSIKTILFEGEVKDSSKDAIQINAVFSAAHTLPVSTARAERNCPVTVSSSEKNRKSFRTIKLR